MSRPATPRQARVVALRHGLVDGRVHTLLEIGRELGCCRERVRQIENDALQRLRRDRALLRLNEEG